jgi:hypothetical protein
MSRVLDFKTIGTERRTRKISRYERNMDGYPCSSANRRVFISTTLMPESPLFATESALRIRPTVRQSSPHTET